MVKHNDLILKTAYKLTLIELRILLFAIAKMNPLQQNLPETHILDARKMAEIYNVPLHKFWQQISMASEKLFGRDIILHLSPDVKKMSKWVYDVELDSASKTITFLFHRQVLERLHAFENNFTSYQLENIVQMGSAYSIRFYEWSILHLKASKKDTATYRKTVAELKETLDLGTKYPILGDFRRRVLDAAQDEINKQTDVKFSYHIEKSGHAIKYIEFAARYNKRHKEDSERLPALPEPIHEDHTTPEAICEAYPPTPFDELPDFLKTEEQPPLPENEPKEFRSMQREKEHHPFNHQPQVPVTPYKPRLEPVTATLPPVVPATPNYEVRDCYYYSKEACKKRDDDEEQRRNDARGIELEYPCDIASATDPDALTRYIRSRLLLPNKALKACSPRPLEGIKIKQRYMAEARARRAYLRKEQKKQITA